MSPANRSARSSWAAVPPRISSSVPNDKGTDRSQSFPLGRLRTVRSEPSVQAPYLLTSPLASFSSLCRKLSALTERISPSWRTAATRTFASPLAACVSAMASARPLRTALSFSPPSRAWKCGRYSAFDVAGGDKIPHKGGPGLTQSDLLVINKTDLAPAVGADLEVMARDAKKMRGCGPFVLAEIKHGVGGG